MKVLVILMELFSSIQTSYEDPEKNKKFAFGLRFVIHRDTNQK